MLGEVSGGGKEVVEFGVDDFHDLGVKGFGKRGNGALEAENLLVGGWV